MYADRHLNGFFNYEQFPQNSQLEHFNPVTLESVKYTEPVPNSKMCKSDTEIVYRSHTQSKSPQLLPGLNLSRFNLSKINKSQPELDRIQYRSTNRHRLILDTPFSTRSTISYGLIVFARDTERWAIIQRKHSVEFLLFIRGIYRLTYLPILLSCVTTNEASIIEECLKGGPDIFKDIYLNKLGLSADGLSYALIRMAESRQIVKNMLPKLDLLNNDLSWTWPKGRLHISSDRETPFDCAKREFAEEVEIILPPPLFISDTYVSENIRTITGRNIESRYWIYIIPNEIPMTPPESHPEVADRSWVDIETCRSKMGRDFLLNQVVSMVSSIE